METTIQPNAERSAKAFGCTIEQAKAMFAKNAIGCRSMLERAVRTGKKVNGYTADQLRASVEAYAAASMQGKEGCA